MPSLAQRTPTTPRTNGSVTVTDSGSGSPDGPRVPILRLRAVSNVAVGSSRHIQWAEDVVDNEGMGKKSSKVCCIYHKPKNAGDSSSDESSDSSNSDSDSEPDLSRAQPASRRKNTRNHDGHDHDHDAEQDHSDCAAGAGSDQPKIKTKIKPRKASPNAYERVPQRKKDKA